MTGAELERRAKIAPADVGPAERTEHTGERKPSVLALKQARNTSMSAELEIVAMHGWAGDARCWEPWRQATRELGWCWQAGERGYGGRTPREPGWSGETTGAALRLVIGHSLGPHLLPPGVLGRAQAVVLLASFGAFVPPGREGRRARAALAGMAACLGDEGAARAMLKDFLQRAAKPQAPELLPPGPLDGPLDEMSRARLLEDLERLGSCGRLPGGFPAEARVLIVEAEEDQIVEPATRMLLREALPEAEVITLPGAGHALLAGDVIRCVVDWVEAWRGSEKQGLIPGNTYSAAR
jgi:pimeloyl-[acyl-carrier protein] methyl ester esterase